VDETIMTPVSPFISVLMSVFNGEDYLAEAIESILNQDFLNFEFIIINDCSTDRSLEIINSFSDPRICLIQNDENKGLTQSLNIGLNHARGKYIVRMDADDISVKNRISTQVKWMEKNPAVIVCGSARKIIENKNTFIDDKKSEKKPIEESEMVYELGCLLETVRGAYGASLKKADLFNSMKDVDPQKRPKLEEVVVALEKEIDELQTN
jgi:glycosyltransferase involved in cell wall biosynthesis